MIRFQQILPLCCAVALSCGDAQRAADPAPPSATPVPALPAAQPPNSTVSHPDSAQVVSPTRPPTSPPTTPARDTAPPTRAEQDQGARALARASAAYERLRSMKADFVMSTENPLLRRTTVSRGTLYQKNPDKLLLRFTDPVGDIIVSDGKFFWIYYPSTDDKQVIKSAAAAGGGAVDLRAQFIGDPMQRFQFTLDGQEAVGGRPADVLTLIPRQDLGYKKLKVWVDAQDGLVRQFEITEENTTRHLVLSDFQANPTLGDDLFRFTPPPGARIVERN